MSDNETALVVRTGVPAGLIPSSLEQAIQLAKLMSDSGLVPKHLVGQPANCFMVIEQATRWGMSPFAVAQCTSVIGGKLMYEGKLVAAVINARGELAERLNYRFDGSGDARSCTAYGRVKGEDTPREVTCVLRDVRTTQACWKQQPDMQLSYSAARHWARRHLPEVMLGVYSPDEFAETVAPRQLEAANDTAAPKAPSATAVVPPADATTDAEFEEPDNLLADATPEVDDLPKPGEFRDQTECWTWRGAKGNKKWGQGPGEWASLGMEPIRSNRQNSLIHVLRQERGYDDPTWRSKLALRFNKDSSADLSVREAGALIDAMERATAQHGTADDKKARQLAKAEAMGREYGEQFPELKEGEAR
jgi:hypothetical protein